MTTYVGELYNTIASDKDEGLPRELGWCDWNKRYTDIVRRHIK